MRYFLKVAYKGTAYQGWQTQKNGVGVQEVLSKAISTLLGKETKVLGSGRTDAGVHAASQPVHFDGPDDLSSFRFEYGLNAILPPDIAVSDLRRVQPDANVRFSALSRKYEYRVATRPNPFLTGMVYFFYKQPDVESMNKAASFLIGEHDFQSLSKTAAKVNHYLCRVDEAYWEQKGELLIFHIRANRFLHGMVRATVGTLLDIGMGKRKPEEMKTILNKKDRKAAGRAAPPEGLFLVDVHYPESVYLDQS
jgi:tRNA pseudouridine38-40 synthase